ncbi:MULTISPECIES: helix-turn-helix domain-containing protein [Streptomycetaceae]|uniref:helix-turn-helix domain-containing protein n=1 Tax=Streptomycetaceae TaxID=2062 RepID=UPI00364EECF5
MLPAPPPSDDWVIARRRAVGQNLRAARRAARLTQEELAELSGLDRQAVNRIEQAHQSALLDNLIRLAAGLGIPLAELVK